MFKDKRPGKWLLLGTLLLIVLLGLVMFFGMRAQAAPEKFLPIKEVKTQGGITVWMVEDHSLPIVALRFLFLDSGTALDPEKLQGLARLLSNTMDEGAGGLDSQAFQKALSDHSITLMFNAGRDGFGGELKSLTRHKQKAFDLLALALSAPRFDGDAVTRMKDGNLSRIKSSLSEPDWLAARLINDRAFENHPYSKNSGGTLSSIPAITPDDLRDFKKNNLTRDRLLVAVAGDIKDSEIGPLVDKVFSSLPEKSATAQIADTDISNTGKTYLYDQPIPQTMVEIMFPAFDQKDPDYYALQVLNYVFGGAGFGSRLMETAREQKGLTYGIYSNIQDFRHADAMGVSTSTKNASAGEMLSIIRTEMTKLQNEAVSAKELADAKSYITGSMPLALDSTEDIAGMVLSLRAKNLPIDYLDSYASNINAVTPAKVQEVAKRVLNPENMVTALVGKPEGVEGAITVKELPNVR